MKIFIIGLNKTGTKTISKALEILGFKNRLSYGVEYLNMYHNNDIQQLLNLVDKYEVIEDLPWPMLYKTFYETYPDAYYILTVRKSAEVWYESQIKHNKRVGPNSFNQIIYGMEPEENKEIFIQKYVDHNNEVLAFFKNKGNFITLNFEEGDGWKKVCSFFNLPRVYLPFPHRNPSKTTQSLRVMVKNKILQLFLNSKDWFNNVFKR